MESLDRRIARPTGKIIALKGGYALPAGKANAVWMQTASGRPFDLAAEDHRQVNIHDIASQLAKQCRFSGACTSFYSVAQHSVLVSLALRKFGPEAELLGLMRDAHEAYMGNITPPVKNLIVSLVPYDILGDLARVVDKAIARALRLPELTLRIAHAVSDADDRVLSTELRDVMADAQRDWKLTAMPLPAPIIPWPWPKAEEKFLCRFEELAISSNPGAA